MKLRTWLALPAVIAAFVAGRETAPRVEAKPVADAPAVVHVASVAPAVRCPALPACDLAGDDDDPDDDPDAIDVAETEALRMLTRIAALESSLGADGALRGQVRDPRTGEALAGVTVVTYRAGDPSQAAITDEHGWYEIAPLPPGTYIVTLYFVDRTVERSNVVVEGRRITALHGEIEAAPVQPEVIDHGHGITLDHVRDLSAEWSSDDPDDGSEPPLEGVTFSGGTSLETTYVVD